METRYEESHWIPAYAGMETRYARFHLIEQPIDAGGSVGA